MNALADAFNVGESPHLEHSLGNADEIRAFRLNEKYRESELLSAAYSAFNFRSVCRQTLSIREPHLLENVERVQQGSLKRRFLHSLKQGERSAHSTDQDLTAENLMDISEFCAENFSNILSRPRLNQGSQGPLSLCQVSRRERERKQSCSRFRILVSHSSRRSQVQCGSVRMSC